MTPRSPAEIFDEVLDAWDDLKRASLLSGRVPGGRDAAWFDGEMLRHTAQVRAYREEFREASDAERLLQTATSFEDRSEEPEEEEAHIPATPQPADVIDLMEALKANLRKATPPSWPLREEAAVNTARDGDLAHGGIPEDDLEPDDPEPTPEDEPACIEPSDEVDALLDDIFSTESVPDRSERLAARYTKGDGSAK